MERAASSYYENVKTMSPAVLDGDGKLMSFGDCLRERKEFFANQQIKMMIGKGAMESIDARDLQRAQDNIRRDFIFTGIAEYFDASILLLSQIIRWHPCAYGKLNSRSSKKRLVGEDLSTLRRINYLENVLYEEARDKLLVKMSCAGRKFDVALSELSKLTSEAAKNGRHAAHALSDNNQAIKSFLRDS